jgi:pimeloyl-ACP methyl ester carboxylesterase
MPEISRREPMNTTVKPTIVFVHGAFADSSSWNDVISLLQPEGYIMIAVANPLRTVKYDADYLASLLQTINGPIVLVGHSYGGMVITNAIDGKSNVTALVYVAGFAPEIGESAADLSGRFPGGTLGPTLTLVELPDGNKDAYIQQDKYWAQFVADVTESQAQLMAAIQRPITEAGLTGASEAESWKNIPSWFVFGELDKNIPVASHRFMAERANAKEIIEIKGASHALSVSKPEAVANIIRNAVNATIAVELG